MRARQKRKKKRKKKKKEKKKEKSSLTKYLENIVATNVDFSSWRWQVCSEVPHLGNIHELDFAARHGGANVAVLQITAVSDGGAGSAFSETITFINLDTQNHSQKV
jgi:hypothetical protein